MKRFDALIGGLLLARCHAPSFAMGEEASKSDAALGILQGTEPDEQGVARVSFGSRGSTEATQVVAKK
jgi:hypothetical protein